MILAPTRGVGRLSLPSALHKLNCFRTYSIQKAVRNTYTPKCCAKVTAGGAMSCGINIYSCTSSVPTDVSSAFRNLSVFMSNRCLLSTRPEDTVTRQKSKSDFEYQTSVDRTLQSLQDQLEVADLDVVQDLSLDDGTLTVDLGEAGAIVVNKHYITFQIWYSSPKSGADYFEFTSTPRWTSKRSKVTLSEKMSKDIHNLTGTAITLTQPA
eukprot:Lankesteria_metandrocarpae@DN4802_c0_g1_i3.p2